MKTLWLALKHGKKIKDTVALGVFGGAIGTAAMTLSNYLIYRAGKTEILYGHIASSIFMRPFRTKQKKNFILGQIFHLANGSAAGLVMVQIFKKTGTDLAILKGTMIGMMTWEGLYTVGQRLGIYTARPHLTKTGYSALWNNFVYGVVSAYSIKWLAHPSVFRSKEQAEQRAEEELMNSRLYQFPGGDDRVNTLN